jgi:hypothetical protein
MSHQWCITIRFSRTPLGVGVQEYAMVVFHLESIKPALANPGIEDPWDPKFDPRADNA